MCLYRCRCVCLCVHGLTHEYSCPERPREGIGTPGVTGGCDSPSRSLTTGPPLQRPFSPFFLFFPFLLFLLCQNLAGELSLALKSLLDLKLIAIPLPPPQKCWDSKCVVLSMPDSVLSFSVCNPHSTKPEGPCPSSRLGSATAFPYPRGSSGPLCQTHRLM